MIVANNSITTTNPLAQMSKDIIINKLQSMDKSEVLEIMHECAEILGLIDIDTYIGATGEKRRTIYDKMEKGRIKSFPIGKNVFPLINL